MIRAISKSLGVYTAATPSARRRGRSSSGMIPPTTTGASTPASCRAATSSGTSSRCLPDKMDMPIRSTSSSRALATIWGMVERMPW